jgi:hypothetical protein
VNGIGNHLLQRFCKRACVSFFLQRENHIGSKGEQRAISKSAKELGRKKRYNLHIKKAGRKIGYIMQKTGDGGEKYGTNGTRVRRQRAKQARHEGRRGGKKHTQQKKCKSSFFFSFFLSLWLAGRRQSICIAGSLKKKRPFSKLRLTRGKKYACRGEHAPPFEQQRYPAVRDSRVKLTGK